MKGNTAKSVVDVCRGAQSILALLIFALSLSLTLRWSSLENACGKGPYDHECSKIVSGTGGLEYCVFVGAWILLDIGVWLIDACVTPLPWFVVYFCDMFTGGFALGGGCTLAALINGWDCSAGADGSLRLCHQLYANIAFLFTVVIVTWTGIFCSRHLNKGCLRPDSRLS